MCRVSNKRRSFFKMRGQSNERVFDAPCYTPWCHALVHLQAKMSNFYPVSKTIVLTIRPTQGSALLCLSGVSRMAGLRLGLRYCLCTSVKVAFLVVLVVAAVLPHPDSTFPGRGILLLRGRCWESVLSHPTRSVGRGVVCLPGAPGEAGSPQAEPTRGDVGLGTLPPGLRDMLQSHPRTAVGTGMAEVNPRLSGTRTP